MTSTRSTRLTGRLLFEKAIQYVLPIAGLPPGVMPQEGDLVRLRGLAHQLGRGAYQGRLGLLSYTRMGYMLAHLENRFGR